MEWPSRGPVEELHMVLHVAPVARHPTVLTGWSCGVVPISVVTLLSLVTLISLVVPTTCAARVARGPATPPRR